MIARRDRGIATPKDLRGKTIGVVRQSQGEFFLGGFLTLHGLTLDDIRVVNLSPGQIVDAMTTGDIDAAMIWEPNIYRIQKRLGDNAISFPGQDEQDFYFLLIGRAPFLDASPEVIKRFIHALRQAETFLQHHRAEGQALIAQRLGANLDFIQTIWTKNRFRITLPQALLIAMEDEARWCMQQKKTADTPIPNYLNFISATALEQVAPEAVTFIR